MLFCFPIKFQHSLQKNLAAKKEVFFWTEASPASWETPDGELPAAAPSRSVLPKSVKRTCNMRTQALMPARKQNGQQRKKKSHDQPNGGHVARAVVEQMRKRIFFLDLSEARSRLYRSRSLQPNTHVAAFFEIYNIQKPLHRSKFKILQKFDNILSKF